MEINSFVLEPARGEREEGNGACWGKLGRRAQEPRNRMEIRVLN